MPIIDYFPLDTPREKQVKILAAVEQAIKAGHKNIVISAPTGCHEPDQKVIMFDGTLKRVDQIVVGDTLMGPDSQPRCVLKLYHGHGPMYCVQRKRGKLGLKPFVVNEDHVLSLKITPNFDYYIENNQFTSYRKLRPFKAWKKKEQKLKTKWFERPPDNWATPINIAVKDYLSQTKSKKHLEKLYFSPAIRFQSEPKLDIPPYILGIWLGDGSSNGPKLHASETQIISAWTSYVEKQGLVMHISKAKNPNKNRPCRTYSATSGRRGSPPSYRNNTFTNKLIKLSLINNKHIPHEYKTASIKDRFELLAGLIDTDGHGKPDYNGTISFCSTRKTLADDVAFLARSLGFYVYQHSTIKKCQNGGQSLAHILSIVGDTHKIPNRLTRKITNKRRIDKIATHQGFSVTRVNDGEFFGFELDKDHLYLLDDFTVTHNSGKSVLGVTCCLWASDSKEAETLSGQGGGYVLVTQKMLQDQLEDEFASRPEIGCVLIKSAIEYPCRQFKTCSLGLKTGKCRAAIEGCCTYRTQKQLFLSSRIGVTNYSYFMTSLAYATEETGLNPRRVMILDECHNIESQVLHFVDLNVTAEMLKTWAPAINKVPPMKEMAEFVAWVKGTYYGEIESHFKMLQEIYDGMKDAQAAAEMFKLEMYMAKLNRAIGHIERDPQDWVYWQQKDEKGGLEANCRPLNAAPFVHNLLFKAADIRIFMSAYPGQKPIFCRSLGLKEESAAWLKVGHTFPVENRKIIVSFVGPMGMNNIEATKPRLFNFIDKAMAHHTGERGIIHCGSYKLGKAIYDYLMTTPEAGRVTFPQTVEERDEAFKMHGQMEGSVIISPSMMEGFNFAGDLARWQLIVKVPYGNLGDRQIATRKDIDPDWYAVQAVGLVVQASGRIVRSESDWGITYITDADFQHLWRRNSTFFPKWWSDALVWKEKGSSS